MKRPKLLLYVMLIAWLLIPLPMMAINYLEEDFDSPSFTNGIPAGWDNSGGTTINASYRWNRYSPGYDEIGACLRFNSYNNQNGYNNILVLPEMTLSSTEQTEIMFKFKNPTGGPLSLSVQEVGGATITLDSNMVADDWTDKKYSLTQFGGKTIKIVFNSISNYNNGDAYHYLDNVLVRDVPQCAAPINVIVTEITQTTASINWSLEDAIAESDYYKIRVTRITDGKVVFTNDELYTPIKMTTLSGLEANTEYSITLQTNCSDSSKGLSEFSKPIRFKTLLDPIDIPYSQNFDATTAVPIGILNQGTVLVSTSVRNGTAGNSLQLTAKVNKMCMVVFPQLKHAANDMQFAAVVRSSVANLEYYVGLTSDPSDASSLIPIYNGVLRDKDVWSDLRFNTSSSEISEENMSFAILVPMGKDANMFVDDINITTIPSCLRPEHLNVVSADSVSATIKWVGANSPAARQVELKSTSKTNIVELSTNPGTLSNLVSNVSYTIRVRDICSVGDTSEWSLPKTFATTCRVSARESFDENFDGGKIPDCWVQRQTVAPTGLTGNDNGDAAWDYYKQGILPAHTTLRLKQGRAGAHTLMIAKPICIEQNGAYDVVMTLQRNSITDPNEGIRLWINNTPDTINAQRCEFIPSGYTFEPAEVKSDWYQYRYNIKRHGTVYIILEGITQNAGATYIDDIAIVEAEPCRRVLERRIGVNNITTTSADIYWPQEDYTTNAVIRYTITPDKGTAVTAKVDVPVSITDIQSHTVQNLTPATHYTVKCEIANYCGAADTSAWVTYQTDFITECLPPTLPLKYDFEDGIVPPLCWNIFSDGKKDYWLINEEPNYATSGTKSLQMISHYSNVNPRLTFRLENVPNGEYQVRFSMYRRNIYYSGDDSIEGIKVWLSDSPELPKEFPLAYILSCQDNEPKVPDVGMYTYIYDFNITGDTYLIIEGISDYHYPIYIDDIIIRAKADCAEMNDFKLEVVNESTIDIVTADPDGTQWEAEYGLRGFELGTGISISASTQRAAITGLTAGTAYEVYIRKKCGDSSYSDWTAPRYIYTPFIVTAENEFFEGFESYDDGKVIEHYFYIDHNSDVVKETKAMSLDYKIVPYEGNRFASRYYNTSETRFVQVMLKGGVNYEVSGYFVSDSIKAFDPNNTLVSLVYSTKPVFEKANKVATVGVIHHWEYVSGFFMAPEDGIYYVGYNINQNSKPNMSGADNFRIREVACVPPSSTTVSNTNTDVARIDWVSQGDKWEIKVSDNAAFDFNATEGAAFTQIVENDNYCLITGLNDNTQYYYAIRTLCDEVNSAWTRVKSFRTACVARELPYYLDFEDTGLADMLCWEALEESAVVTSASTAKYGSSSLSVAGATMVSPTINTTSLEGFMVNGWVRTSADNVVFSVGLMTDREDVSTFEELGQVVVPAKNVWQEFMVRLENLNDVDGVDMSRAKYIALILNTTGDDNKIVTYLLDDVLIDRIPTCPKPTEPVVSDILNHSFKLAWQTKGEETEWRVLGKSLTGKLLFDTIVNTNPCTISGLGLGTTYAVTIQAVCADDDSSVFTECGIVTTRCDEAYKLPYVLDFENSPTSLPNCWNVTESNSLSSSEWKLYDDGSGKNTLYYSGFSSGKQYYSHLMSPVFDLTNVKSAMLEVDVVNNNNGRLIFIAHDKETSTQDTLGVVTAYPNGDSHNFVYDLTKYVGHIVEIELYALGGTASKTYMAVTSFVIRELNSCSKPGEITITDVHSTSVDILLTDTAGTHTAWQYVVGEKGFDPATATLSLIHI